MDPASTDPAAAGTPLIWLDRVGRTYPGPPEVVALRDATFTVNQGEYVALMGPSGSGKSTLLNVLGLLTRPTSGHYVLGSLDVATLTSREMAGVRTHWIGTIFQAFHLLSDRTAEENVSMGALYGGGHRRRNEIRSRARTMLERVGLSHRIDAMPSTLSGGERQRVAIARALMMQPRLLLCDEPTGNLDSTMTAEILSLFGELHAQGQTLVMITHSPEVAARAGRRLSITDGVVSER